MCLETSWNICSPGSVTQIMPSFTIFNLNLIFRLCVSHSWHSDIEVKISNWKDNETREPLTKALNFYVMTCLMQAPPTWPPSPGCSGRFPLSIVFQMWKTKIMFENGWGCISDILLKSSLAGTLKSPERLWHLSVGTQRPNKHHIHKLCDKYLKLWKARCGSGCLFLSKPLLRELWLFDRLIFYSNHPTWLKWHMWPLMLQCESLQLTQRHTDDTPHAEWLSCF